MKARHALLALVALLPPSTGWTSESSVPGVPAPEAMARLQEGNRRFAAGEMHHPHQSADRRSELTAGQRPFAVVLTCSDSRVAPEIYFDQGLGDLFVMRNAGNVLDDHIIGSIEYAVAHLGTKLIVVVGHSQCGAVTAAAAGGHAPGHLRSVVESIEPAVKSVQGSAGDLVPNAIRANALRVAAILRQSDPVIGKAVSAGDVQVVAAHYDLATGAVEFYPQP